MNSSFLYVYSTAVTVLVTINWNLDTVESCAVELDSVAELEVSVSRLWLPELSHFHGAGHLALSIVAVIVSSWSSSCKWSRLDVNDLFIIRASRRGFAHICTAMWAFDWCLVHLINVALSELISDPMKTYETGPVCNETVPSSLFGSPRKIWTRTCSPIVNSRSFATLIYSVFLIALYVCFWYLCVQSKLVINRRFRNKSAGFDQLCYSFFSRAVFKWLSKKQYQSNHSFQSQKEQTAQWTNQNS